eukprot:7746972-Prorocentrum_lima.AAC.1
MDTVFKSWLYVENYTFKSIPGGVYITNWSYFRVWCFTPVVVPSTTQTDNWWFANDIPSIVSKLGYN